MFTDVNHVIEDTYSSIVMVDQGRDSVDFTIANSVKEGDVVITQDYGVAAVALSKGAVILNQNGMEFNSWNIERLIVTPHSI